MITESKFVTPVVDTMMNVFDAMIKMEPAQGETRVKEDDISSGDVTGLLKMVSDRAKGSVSISFTKPVAIDLVKRMLHMEINEIDDMARDMAGEMANIIVGGAKNLLEQQGYSFDMSLPKIFAGEGHRIEHSFRGKTIEIPFSVDSGDFFIEVNFTESH